MPSLIDLRRRIRAVKVDAADHQGDENDRGLAPQARAGACPVRAPFAQRMLQVLNGLVSRVEQEAHPLLRVPPAGEGRPLLIVITADRGLCGSFNSNVIKAAGQFIVSEGQDRAIALGLIGRKGRDFFRRRGFDVRYEQVGIFQKLTFADAVELADVANRGVHLGGGLERVSRLQRIQVGHDPADRGRAAAADSAARGRRRGRAIRRLPLRARPGQIFTDLLRATSRCRCIARCSSRTPRSSRRR
jgi:hypothetical protein